MFRYIKVPANTVAIAVRHGAIDRVMKPGRHLVFGLARITYHRSYDLFVPPAGVPLEAALLHPDLAALLRVISVPDGNIGIVYRAEHYVNTEGPGLVAYFLGPVVYRVNVVDTTNLVVPSHLVALARVHASLRAYIRIVEVPVGRLGLLMVDGVLTAELTAGTYYYFFNTHTVELKLAPIGIEGMEINGHEILTRDRVSVRINYYLRYRITDVLRALVEVVDFARELRVAAALALREYVGALTLDELLAAKLTVDAAVAESLADVVARLGVAYIDGGIKDVILPGEMRTIMNRVLLAEKTAEANAIERRDAAAAVRTKLNTAKLMTEHPMLRRLEEMAYIERVAEHVDRITVAGGRDVMSGLQELLVPKE